MAKHIINLHHTKHRLQKTNLVTEYLYGRSFDSYQCQDCGAKGKRFGISETIELSGKKKTVEHCIHGAPEAAEIKRIVLLETITAGGATDLIKGAEMDTLDDASVPNGTLGGVWVWSESIKSKVRLLSREFEFIQ